MQYAPSSPKRILNALESISLLDPETFTDEIGHGKYGDAFRFGDKLCIKRLKQNNSSSFLGINVPLPQKIYLGLRFQFTDLNVQDFNNSRDMRAHLSAEVQPHFAQVYATTQTDTGSFLFSELVCNQDGNVSKPLSKLGGVLASHEGFWNDILKIRDELISKRIPSFGVQSTN